MQSFLTSPKLLLSIEHQTSKSFLFLPSSNKTTTAGAKIRAANEEQVSWQTLALWTGGEYHLPYLSLQTGQQAIHLHTFRGAT